MTKRPATAGGTTAMPAGDANHATPRTVPVSLGARSYEILIGNGRLSSAGPELAARFGKRNTAIVTDTHVAAHHLAALEASLQAAGLKSTAIVLEPGEATKSFRVLGPLCERLLVAGIERGDLVIALGGGVIGDLTGFAASILRRGVRMVQIPTSLLAQVDSSVGGKTGINTPQGKNLVGTFHQPSLVLADTGVLATLPPRELRAGYAEVVKYGLLGDAPFFDWLEANWRRLFGNDLEVLADAVEISCKAKAAIVARDETETGERMLLNLGHTFGHALEAWCGFSSRLLHGEAVAIGMAQAFRFSAKLGHAPPTSAHRAEAHLKAVGLPTRIHDIPGQDRPEAAALFKLMSQDKKVRDGKMTLILVRGIGQAFITRDVAPAAILQFLEEEIAGG